MSLTIAEVINRLNSIEQQLTNRPTVAQVNQSITLANKQLGDAAKDYLTVKDVENINQRLTSALKSINDLTQDLESEIRRVIENEITADDIPDGETKVTMLLTERDSLQILLSEVNTLISDMNNVDDDIADLQTLTSTHDNRLDILESDLSDLTAVVGGLTTADVPDSSNRRYVTDAQLTVIGATSGSNSGDNAPNSDSNDYADTVAAQALSDANDYTDTSIASIPIGIHWHPAVQLINVIGEVASPQTPIHLDGYILATGANTGDWSSFSPGDLIQYQHDEWVFIKAMAIGDHVGVSVVTGTPAVGAFTGKDDQLVEITGGTAGAFTYTFTVPDNGDGVYVENSNAYLNRVSYIYSESLSQWVQLAVNVPHPHDLSDLTQSGATLNQTIKWDGSNWVPTSSSGGSGRADAILELDASDGSTIDVETAMTILFNMDADLTNITYSVNPSEDGMRLILIFKKTNPIHTATLDPTKFRGNLDAVIPSPLLNPTINTRDIFTFIWNATDAIFTLTGFIRRDP